MRGGWLGAILVLFGFSLPAAWAAELRVDVATCIGILNDNQRLECYDRSSVQGFKLAPTFKVPDLLPPTLLRLLDSPGLAPAVAAPVAAVVDLGAWRLQNQTDSFDGKKVSIAYLEATETTLSPQRRAPITSKRAELRFLCNKGALQFQVVLEGELVGSHGVSVDYRIDEGAPVTKQRWETSQDSTAIGHWTKAGTIAMMNRLEKGTRFRIRSTHNVFGMLEAEFQTIGAGQAFKQLRADCPSK